MAVVLHEIVDSDFEYFVKITTTSTNDAASVFDASAAAVAGMRPRRRGRPNSVRGAPLVSLPRVR